MRRYRYYSGGQNDGKGCAIFFLIALLFPLISAIFAFFEFIVRNIFLIGGLMVVLMFIVFHFLDKNNIEE